MRKAPSGRSNNLQASLGFVGRAIYLRQRTGTLRSPPSPDARFQDCSGAALIAAGFTL